MNRHAGLLVTKQFSQSGDAKSSMSCRQDELGVRLQEKVPPNFWTMWACASSNNPSLPPAVLPDFDILCSSNAAAQIYTVLQLSDQNGRIMELGTDLPTNVRRGDHLACVQLGEGGSHQLRRGPYDRVYPT